MRRFSRATAMRNSVLSSYVVTRRAASAFFAWVDGARSVIVS
jgi:hypothetical protein